MKQFLLSSPPSIEGSQKFVRLSGKDYHYLVRVRRLESGGEFAALLPDGEPVRVRVCSTAGGVLLGECLPAPAPAPDAGLPPMLLFQALPKGAKMDLIIRQAAEGGITEIVGFESARSERRLAGEAAGRLERWRRIVKEARQQSGSPIATELRPPCRFGEMLAYWEELRKSRKRPVGLLLHPAEDIQRDLGACRTGEFLLHTGQAGMSGDAPLAKGSFHGYLEGSPDCVVIAIGPEGGFSPEEAIQFVHGGFKPVSLGNTVLRTETAALYAAAAIRIILLESESWIHKPQGQLIP
jgi:16S rRNA (uracil1498-N3)-methyltransferase